MEAIGLTIGIASLFSTCIECFDLFQAAKDYDEYVEILLAKLDLEKTRLLIWGNGVGIMKSPKDGRATELDDDSKATTVQRCLERIKSLLCTFDTFQSKYGLRQSDPALIQSTAADGLVSFNSMTMFRLTDRRFWVRNKTSRSFFLPRVKWAIHEKEKFEGLINHLKDFVDGLNEIVPVNRETQDQIVQDDIASIIDVSKLRLVEAACEGLYRTWSEKASQVISDSEAGTLDRRTIEEYIRDQDISNGIKSSGEENIVGRVETQEDSKMFLQNSSSVFFVATPKCESHLESQTALCTSWASEPRFPYDPMDYSIVYSIATESTIGGRILNTIDLQRVNSVFDPLFILSILKDNDTRFLKIALPIGKFYIHCSPCKCQLATALNTAYQLSSPAVSARVRVDYRLSSSCSSNQQLERLTHLLDDLKRSEILNNHERLPYIDRVWLEQKIMELEDEIPTQTRDQPLIDKIFSDYSFLGKQDKKLCGVVIVGEVEHIQPLMQGPPFPKSARMPRETEIWEMNYAQNNSWRRVPLGSFTPRNFQ